MPNLRLYNSKFLVINRKFEVQDHKNGLRDLKMNHRSKKHKNTTDELNYAGMLM
jgi:hypothetical protein